MTQTAHSPSTMSLAQARHIVKELFTPSLAIYWADFLISIIGGSICFILVRRVLTPGSAIQAVTFVLCCLLYFRAVMFTHEMVHLRDKSFRSFRIVWNLLCGIPFLVPSFMYYTHVDHHMRKHFGTDEDGEYLRLGTSSFWHLLVYMCQPLVIPVLAVNRFLILAPISWVCPPFRRFVHEHASSMVMDPSYIRPLPTRQALRIIRLQEVLCFLWVAFVATLLFTRTIPIGFLYTAYGASVTILYINHLRTLGAHRYLHDGRELTFVEQLLDSVNYPDRFSLSPLWAPVGLRFHALHHLFPSLPYHNLGKAHAKLMAELPADSPYRQTSSPGLPTSLLRLVRSSLAHSGSDEPCENRRPTRPHHSASNQTLSGAH